MFMYKATVLLMSYDFYQDFNSCTYFCISHIHSAPSKGRRERLGAGPVVYLLTITLFGFSHS